MKHARPIVAGKPICPKFWALFCEYFLGIEVRLAKEVWSRLYPSADVLFQLAKVEETGRRPEQIKRFGELLPPGEILKACERISPSRTGRPRRRDVVRLEESILARCDGQGRWI